MTLTENFNDFLKNFKNQDKVFKEYSIKFKEFWNNAILNDSLSSLDESEMDPIIRMIDSKAKGKIFGELTIANTFVFQPNWYRAFRFLKENKDIREITSELFEIRNDDKLIEKINELESKNKGLKNAITSKSGIMLNAFLFLSNPDYFITVLSLEHRSKILKYFEIDETFSSYGENIIKSNRLILEHFASRNIIASPRTISIFFYEGIKDNWTDPAEIIDDINTENEIINTDEQIFALEKYLEEFLISNWEKTEFGEKYDLIFSNDGELSSQQYPTDIGRIDILVKEKKTDSYVVIELKKKKTSDGTVGQIARYMGWVKEKLAGNNTVKGIIIGFDKDEKIIYALKSVPNVELFLYKVNFSLNKIQ